MVERLFLRLNVERFMGLSSRVSAMAVGADVVSMKRGPQIQTPIYYNPHYGDPPKGTPNFGEAPWVCGDQDLSMAASHPHYPEGPCTQ